MDKNSSESCIIPNGIGCPLKADKNDLMKRKGGYGDMHPEIKF